LAQGNGLTGKHLFHFRLFERQRFDQREEALQLLRVFSVSIAKRLSQPRPDLQGFLAKVFRPSPDSRPQILLPELARSRKGVAEHFERFSKEILSVFLSVNRCSQSKETVFDTVEICDLSRDFRFTAWRNPEQALPCNEEERTTTGSPGGMGGFSQQGEPLWLQGGVCLLVCKGLPERYLEVGSTLPFFTGEVSEDSEELLKGLKKVCVSGKLGCESQDLQEKAPVDRVESGARLSEFSCFLAKDLREQGRQSSGQGPCFRLQEQSLAAGHLPMREWTDRGEIRTAVPGRRRG
jgi:hypothetical protein